MKSPDLKQEKKVIKKFVCERPEMIAKKKICLKLWALLALDTLVGELKTH